jgi:hypothetical protein
MTQFDRALDLAYDRLAQQGRIDSADRLCLAVARLPRASMDHVYRLAAVNSVESTASALIGGLVGY